MQSYILDARTIDPSQDPADFLADFYSIQKLSLFEIKKLLFASDQIRVTEVFNWPVDTPNWKAIADTLENIQQHSPTFYVIWGPETENAIAYEEARQGGSGEAVQTESGIRPTKKGASARELDSRQAGAELASEMLSDPIGLTMESSAAQTGIQNEKQLEAGQTADSSADR